MASYKSNFIKCIIIVFYFIMNIDNAYCPEENECLEKMKLYIGHNFTDVLKCARWAIIKHSELPDPPQTSEIAGTPNTLDKKEKIPGYIEHYLNVYVIPFISNTESIPLDEFCSSKDILYNSGIEKLNLELYVDPQFKITEDTDGKEIIKEACKKNLQYLSAISIEKIIIKDFERFTGNPFEEEYLRAYSKKISLKETAESRKRQTPQQYCRSVANK